MSKELKPEWHDLSRELREAITNYGNAMFDLGQNNGNNLDLREQTLEDRVSVRRDALSEAIVNRRADQPRWEQTHARYDNGWYYCWLVEKRGGPRPEWFGADCFWHTNAQLAEWYARKSDAETVAAEMLDINVVVCEHGFQLDEKGNP